MGPVYVLFSLVSGNRFLLQFWKDLYIYKWRSQDGCGGYMSRHLLTCKKLISIHMITMKISNWKMGMI